MIKYVRKCDSDLCLTL